MNTKDYIATGIIDSYVLGSVNEQERREVECLSHIYPEILEELKLSQQSIEKFAFNEAVEPPKELKAKIFAAIKNESSQTTNGVAKKIELHADKNNNAGNGFKWISLLAAACLLGAVAFIYKLNQDNNHLEQKIAKVEQDGISKVDEQKIAGDKMLVALNETTEEKNILLNQNTQKIMLKGTDKNPENLATIFYNPQEDKAMLMVNNLPIPPSDHQYQLWAIVDGKPLDLGVFDMKSSDVKAMVKINASKVQAFAITMETLGGNPTPNLEQLKVIGNV